MIVIKITTFFKYLNISRFCPRLRRSTAGFTTVRFAFLLYRIIESACNMVDLVYNFVTCRRDFCNKGQTDPHKIIGFSSGLLDIARKRLKALWHSPLAQGARGVWGTQNQSKFQLDSPRNSGGFFGERHDKPMSISRMLCYLNMNRCCYSSFIWLRCTICCLKNIIIIK